jgi:hypothetical protein
LIMKHLIRKQVITLQLDAGQDAFSIQQQARDYYYLHIAPVLEKLFDELSSENEIVHIEKLEIDLGDVGWKNDRFTVDDDSIYQVLKDSISKTLSASGDRADANVVVRYRTLEENTCLQWLYYMESGVLPWQVQTADAKWLQQILHQLAIDHGLIQKTRKLIIDNPWFLARLVREHQEVFLQQLAEVITAKQQPDLTEAVNGLANQFITDQNETRLTKKQIWENVLMHFASGETEIDLHKILLKEKKTILQPVISIDKQRIVEGMFCRYAGLVLLHPFFTHLFNHLLLLEDGMFGNNASREKAVLILYFIATGKTEAKDYELVVPKVLCGMQLHEVIPEESFILTEVEQAEVLNMMHAAIEQWAIMHNTSPDGLREGFLVREGKLLMNDNGIELRLESSAIDVLLDHLPWNLSLIKLPWLDKLIRVEWR